MIDGKVNYGVVSTAGIAPRFINASRCTDNSIFTAVASREVEKARVFADENGLEKYYGSYRELYADPEIDAVYIPTVNLTHYQCAKDALKAGKHVIIEKPMVMHKWQAEELFDLAREKGLFITEAIKVLYLPLIKKVKSIIDSGTYGKIRFMEFKQSYVSGRYNSGWMKQKEMGGGLIYGNEAYFLSLCDYLCGGVKDCRTLVTYGNFNVENQLCVSLLLNGNILATSCVSSEVLFDNGLTVYLERGRMVIPDYWKARKAYIYADGRLIDTLDYPVEFEMQYELQHFSECIISGKTHSDITSPQLSLRNMEICEKLLQQRDECIRV
ncbi:MAG: Gfo/Idh/MocA family oxidoreductase [Erysipelotrichaceae bacterium]|nr:Gfo/Idh/MocA family oxidoreductase [Erysipelotrichaceae bacterium]